MDLRPALYDLADVHGLDGEQTRQLIALTRSPGRPNFAVRRLASLMAVAAGALLGLAAIFLVADHWTTIGRFGRFGLLEALILLCAAGSIARPAACLPLGIASFLATGALLACLSITYRTGADPWQLFAWWCGLTLPLCAGLRADLLWSGWAVVGMTAISLWIRTGAGADASWQIAAWCLALGMVFGLSRFFVRYTGAGLWSYRAAMLMFLSLVVKPGVRALFGSVSSALAIFLAACLLIGFAGVAVSRRRMFDLFNLSAIALALNVMATTYFLFSLLEGGHDSILSLALVILQTAAVFGASLMILLHFSKKSVATGS